MPKKKEPTLKEHLARVDKDFRDITYLMAGAGGGIPYLALRKMVAQFTEDAVGGDAKAGNLVDSLSIFAGMCRATAAQHDVKL